MSTTSFCYHTLGTLDYQYIRTEYKKGEVVIHLRKTKGREYCTNCKSREVVYSGKVNRKISTLPIGNKRITLFLHLHRIKCKKCKLVRQEPIRISDAKKRYTRKLARWVLDLLRCATIKDVARITGLSWDQVKDIEKTYLKNKY